MDHFGQFSDLPNFMASVYFSLERRVSKLVSLKSAYEQEAMIHQVSENGASLHVILTHFFITTMIAAISLTQTLGNIRRGFAVVDGSVLCQIIALFISFKIGLMDISDINFAEIMAQYIPSHLENQNLKDKLVSCYSNLGSISSAAVLDSILALLHNLEDFGGRGFIVQVNQNRILFLFAHLG